MQIIIDAHRLLIDGVLIAELPSLPRAAAVTVWSVPTDYRPNGYFVAVTMPGQPPEVPACSQAHAHRLAALELPPADNAVAQAARAERFAQANVDADQMLAQLDAEYPGREVLTWDQQLAEAEALQRDPAAETPLLAELALYRDIDLQDLADKVLAKSAAYKLASGRIMGARQWVEKALESAETLQDVLDVPSVAQRLAEVSEPAAA